MRPNWERWMYCRSLITKWATRIVWPLAVFYWVHIPVCGAIRLVLNARIKISSIEIRRSKVPIARASYANSYQIGLGGGYGRVTEKIQVLVFCNYIPMRVIVRVSRVYFLRTILWYRRNLSTCFHTFFSKFRSKKKYGKLIAEKKLKYFWAPVLENRSIVHGTRKSNITAARFRARRYWTIENNCALKN